MSHLLEVDGLVVRYGGHLAVDTLSLHVDPGGIVALIGANGAGKTSTLNAIAGVVRPAAGTVRIDGRETTRWPSHRVARHGVVEVPEGRRIIATLTVEENLLLGAYARRRDRAGVARDLEEQYAAFPVLGERRRGRAGLLSGGEQQMLAFARALMSRPKAVLLDEPTMGLAPAVVDRIIAAVKGMAARELAVLMVEQNAQSVLGAAHYAYVLERGRVVGEGRPGELEQTELVRGFLGLSNAPQRTTETDGQEVAHVNSPQTGARGDG